MSFQLAVESHFDAAHRLIHHKGKCRHLHGHTYKVKAVFSSSTILGEIGMIVDFGLLKNLLEIVLASYDHALLLNDKDTLADNLQSFAPTNDAPRICLLEADPTAEVVGRQLFADIQHILQGKVTLLPEQQNLLTSLLQAYNDNKVDIESVCVWEGMSSSVTYSARYR